MLIFIILKKSSMVNIVIFYLLIQTASNIFILAVKLVFIYFFTPIIHTGITTESLWGQLSCVFWAPNCVFWQRQSLHLADISPIHSLKKYRSFGSSEKASIFTYCRCSPLLLNIRGPGYMWLHFTPPLQFQTLLSYANGGIEDKEDSPPSCHSLRTH